MPAAEGTSSAPAGAKTAAGAKTRPKFAGAKTRPKFAAGAKTKVRMRVKLKMQWEMNAKVQVRCAVCGRKVRKDVLARHQEAEVCKRNGAGQRFRPVKPGRRCKRNGADVSACETMAD